MKDPLTSLAFSVQSRKGVYALLLGSGTSKSAEIPTGWEVVLDLISRVARTLGDDCGSDSETWYREKFNEEPTYSGLLSALAKTPAERSTILRRYFEPTEEERQRGAKLPKPGHEAIAELMARGYIRVVVTTNFDRLLELALHARGVTPVVISTSDQAQVT